MRSHLLSQLIVLLTMITLTVGCRLFKHKHYDYSEYDYMSDSTYANFERGDDVWSNAISDLYYTQPSQSAYEVVADLVNTKLDVRFDWSKQRLLGKAWITFKPRFFPLDSITLDAKGMFIHKLELVQAAQLVPLNYSYADSLQLHIRLNKQYAAGESFTLYIEYTARPEEQKESGGSAAITSDKGLYFINPNNELTNKPRQIWTQGETESNSVWFPTIDKPNMKTTLELSITVDSTLRTLSNGILKSSTVQPDGSRTDTWVLDKPFAPYLVMMAIGNFSITKDTWKNIEVNYYTDPEYAPHARKIFGNTPEMLRFFSEKFGYTYPWPKYSQVVVHDFVSGAMENVTATVHYEGLHQTSRELIDENHEDIIAHELSHHWFGDLVTCKSWGQIPLNESFATYAEALWIKHKYGTYEADRHAEADLTAYLSESTVKQMPLIRYRYWDKEDMFDAHSYQKGGYVLRMLHHLVGDEAFTQSLRTYLRTNEYQSVEIDQLRIAFEKTTGRDLKWFFDQWFHRPGHPILTVSQYFDASTKMLAVSLNQTSSYSQVSDDPMHLEPYRLPLEIDVYTAEGKTKHTVIFESTDTTYYYNTSSTPLLVNADAGRTTLCTMSTDKTKSQFVYQFYNAPLYKDKIEALQECAAYQYDDSSCAKVLINGLSSTYWPIRSEALDRIDINDQNKQMLLPLLQKMASSDSSSSNRATAMYKLASFEKKDVLPVFIHALNHDSSYLVLAEALSAMNQFDNELALKEASKLFDEDNGFIYNSIFSIYSGSSDTGIQKLFAEKMMACKDEFKYGALMLYGRYLNNLALPLNRQWLNPLYQTAETNNNWMLRYAAISTLISLRAEWETVISLSTEELNNNKKSDAEKAEIQKAILLFQTEIDKMNNMFIELQSKETNELLKNFYGY